MKIMHIFQVHHRHLRQLVMFLEIVFNIVTIRMKMITHCSECNRPFLDDQCAEENIFHHIRFSPIHYRKCLQQADKVGQNIHRLAQVNSLFCCRYSILYRFCVVLDPEESLSRLVEKRMKIYANHLKIKTTNKSNRRISYL